MQSWHTASWHVSDPGAGLAGRAGEREDEDEDEDEDEEGGDRTAQKQAQQILNARCTHTGAAWANPVTTR
ncbi:hypothetical protein ADK53_02935 [Streptomyces sp. WM6373]|uniref:hypothetical protein n=1 Tax=Streptomyces sp. WM6373 TaxID=1415556 RepID=UPI0006AF35DA|nr:hypothetical protein [Streptomyces sp. WM6373]KOU44527.1 hypothetical protein ADK53_02935 [Streptomyces sp. WM6373]